MLARFEEIAKRMLESAGSAERNQAEGDFRDEEGFLCCGKCGKQKETLVEIFGIKKIVPCLCSCESSEWDRKQEEAKERRRREQIRQLRVNGIQDEGLRDRRFRSAEMTKQMERCRYYAEHFDEFREENIGLIFCGPVGNGKTFAAACIANELIDRGIPVLMTSFPRILNSGYEKNDLVREAQAFDLVIIDDLGTERQSEYALETVYYFLDERYKSGKPTIITTNLSKKDLENPQNMDYKRIYDRVLEMCLPMTFPARDRRKEAAAMKRSRAKELMQRIADPETETEKGAAGKTDDIPTGS